MKITVLGAGSWGTALSKHLAVQGHSVCLCCDDNAIVESINSSAQNPKYFPEYKLTSVEASLSLESASSGSDFLVYALPARAFVDAVKSLDKDLPVLIASKGIPPETGERASLAIKDRTSAVLSGPSFAREVLSGKPTAVTIAGQDQDFVELAADAFHSSRFRIYTSLDTVGVEYGGVLKNIYSIAAGVSDGLKLGDNSRAALITRALAEMARFIEAEGGKPETVYGLSGLGDLTLTACGDLSRNRSLGLFLAEGKSVIEAEKEVGQVAEGRYSTDLILEKSQVSMPIAEQVGRLLRGEVTPEQALDALFSRERKAENPEC